MNWVFMSTHQCS